MEEKIMKKKVIVALLAVMMMTLFTASAFALPTCPHMDGGVIMRTPHCWVPISGWHGYKVINGVRTYGYFRYYVRDVTKECNVCHMIDAYLPCEYKTTFSPGE